MDVFSLIFWCNLTGVKKLFRRRTEGRTITEKVDSINDAVRDLTICNELERIGKNPKRLTVHATIVVIHRGATTFCNISKHSLRPPHEFWWYLQGARIFANWTNYNVLGNFATNPDSLRFAEKIVTILQWLYPVKNTKRCQSWLLVLNVLVRHSKNNHEIIGPPGKSMKFFLRHFEISSFFYIAFRFTTTELCS